MGSFCFLVLDFLFGVVDWVIGGVICCGFFLFLVCGLVRCVGGRVWFIESCCFLICLFFVDGRCISFVMLFFCVVVFLFVIGG